jgi:small-conductance mechanosensitive channel
MSRRVLLLRLRSLFRDAGRSDAGLTRLPIIVGGNQGMHAFMPGLLAAVLQPALGMGPAALASLAVWFALEGYQVWAGRAAGVSAVVKNSLRDVACYTSGLMFFLNVGRPGHEVAAALSALTVAGLVLGIALIQGRAPEESAP